jgi:prophage antirepressor-like protein
MTRIRACCAASWPAWRRIWRRGEGWLVISDIAELLGLRSRQQLLAWIDGGGLQVLGRLDTRPKHPKAQDASDPLHAARPRKSPRCGGWAEKPA